MGLGQTRQDRVLSPADRVGASPFVTALADLQHDEHTNVPGADKGADFRIDHKIGR